MKPRRGGYIRVSASDWEPEHYAARWTPENPASYAWASVDVAWQEDRGSLMSTRKLAEFLGWTRRAADALLFDCARDRARWAKLPEPVRVPKVCQNRDTRSQATVPEAGQSDPDERPESDEDRDSPVPEVGQKCARSGPLARVIPSQPQPQPQLQPHSLLKTHPDAPAHDPHQPDPHPSGGESPEENPCDPPAPTATEHRTSCPTAPLQITTPPAAMEPSPTATDPADRRDPIHTSPDPDQMELWPPPKGFGGKWAEMAATQPASDLDSLPDLTQIDAARIASGELHALPRGDAAPRPAPPDPPQPPRGRRAPPSVRQQPEPARSDARPPDPGPSPGRPVVPAALPHPGGSVTPDTSDLVIGGRSIPGDLVALLSTMPRGARVAQQLVLGGQVETTRHLLALQPEDLRFVRGMGGAPGARPVVDHLREVWGVSPGCLLSSDSGQDSAEREWDEVWRLDPTQPAPEGAFTARAMHAIKALGGRRAIRQTSHYDLPRIKATFLKLHRAAA